MNRRVKFADDVVEALTSYSFPGNVPELENLVEQAIALCSNDTITIDDVSPDVGPLRNGTLTGHTLADIVDDAERHAVEGALKAHDGNRERAAETLGISATTLWRKMSRLGISFDPR